MGRIEFKVNGEQHSVGCEVDSTVMLVDYLRNHLELRGTKYMCREGGCGACLVSVAKCVGGPLQTVNSCMVAITSCHGWEITTIEEVGNRKKGYHILQKTLAENNGTQCGYCTPAWIMNMYSLLQNGNKPTMLDIEKSFAGNACRCTGYRPILQAFKKFAKDAPIADRIMDIEDLQICKKSGKTCLKTREDDDWCMISDDEVKESSVIEIELEDEKYWFKVFDLQSVFDIMNNRGYDVMLVYGNTAKGLYPNTVCPRLMIDITSVPELKGCELDQNLIIGVGININELMDIFRATVKEEYFEYLQIFLDHLDLVASIPIRNLGSVGGNLMIKNAHNEFQSDIFLLFEVVGAYVSVCSCKGVSKKLTMQQFLKEDMSGQVLIDVMLPPLGKQQKLVTYKVMPRTQNAHAVVNAGFLYTLSCNDTVIEARIVFGGLSPNFIRAEDTEKFLVGKPLFSNATLQTALTIMDNELVVDENSPAPSVEYRKQLSLSLFYKGLLSLAPQSTLNSRYVTATTKIHDTRPVSQGKQVYQTNPSLWPLNQPIPKIEALIQCAGETKYTDDQQSHPREVHAAFVLSTIAVGDIVKIDASKALKQKKVIAFYSAADIPGENSFTPAGTPFIQENEEVLANGKVVYYNQPIGIIVAETAAIAEAAAKMVTATYKNVKEPVTDLRVAKNDPNRVKLYTSKAQTEKGTDVAKTISGYNTIFSQLHFLMENMSCVTRPTEEGLEVHVTSQWADAVQVMISRALKIDTNKIDVCNPRLGGGCGLKITRDVQPAIACSLVGQKLNRPCRMVVPLSTCTKAVGKRLPCHADFECDVSAKGVIQSIKLRNYEDNGYSINEMISYLGADLYHNCYTASKWDYAIYDVVTDTASNTWCRSPGTLESIAMAEYIIERISYELCLDPYDVRVANVDSSKYKELLNMAEELKETASYIERKANVAKFNAANKWRKRGLRWAFLKWTPAGNSIFDVNMSVGHRDGSVVITHGGIEMGQGINTKAVQVCAYYLKISIDMIQIKGNNTIIAPNCFLTGGSLGSQNVCLGVRRCCETMLERLAPVRSQMTDPTWLELITKAYDSNIDLQVHSFVGTTDVFTHDVCGVALAETEIDVLTGEFEILRVDILQEVGQSVSPEVDIGQVEGAFIMGLGYWTCEDLVYDKCTGELLTDRTWHYYVPLCRDIPQDFRVYFKKNSYSVDAIMGAKCSGEPPICLSVVIAFALREAIVAARQEVGKAANCWFDIDGPFTIEKINLATCLRKEDFLFT